MTRGRWRFPGIRPTTRHTFAAAGAHLRHGPGSVQPPIAGKGGGVWDIVNPVGTTLLTQLEFTAGDPKWASCSIGRCTNPSDFVVMSVTVVPEPATAALMAAGLGVVGWAARRRQAVTESRHTAPFAG